MNELLINPVFMGFIGTVVGGLVAAVAGMVTKRVEKAPDVQTSLNAAVSSVIDHHVKALAAADAEKAQLHHELAEMRGEIRALRETIAELEEHIDSLTQAMVQHGVKPPPLKRRASGKQQAQ